MYFDYLLYLLKAKDSHSLHSPFVFDFFRKVIESKTEFADFQQVESLKNKLLKDSRTIEITDFGAGSKINKSNNRFVKDIAKNTSKASKFGKLLFRIIHYFGYENIIDFGTSLGITTSFIALANPNSKVITFEGCSETAHIAKENFEELSINNIEIVVGNIDETLPEILHQTQNIDFAFFDANHRFEPTIHYFEACLEKANENSCFVFDDIYWSDEMKQAWKYIKEHHSTTITIDLFWIGIVFFRKKQPKQHFVLKF